jgi:N-acetylglucosaminyldiphosphoundecaprenol N-acetyl-beta-D-mannosaminyltransferase
MPRTEQILGIRFFVGTPNQAVGVLLDTGGYVAIPASPALINLRHDESYRTALEKAALVLLDSELLVLLWKIVTGRKLRKISGTAYLKSLFGRTDRSIGTDFFWVLPSEVAKEKAQQWLRGKAVSPDEEKFFVVAHGAAADHYPVLIAIEKCRPKHVIIALGAGVQEKLALYLKEALLYDPCIHCVGAALGFLTGYERPIPDWAERFRIGWLGRLVAQPRMILPRLGMAIVLASMLIRYRRQAPPVKSRWANL